MVCAFLPWRPASIPGEKLGHPSLALWWQRGGRPLHPSMCEPHFDIWPPKGRFSKPPFMDPTPRSSKQKQNCFPISLEGGFLFINRRPHKECMVPNVPPEGHRSWWLGAKKKKFHPVITLCKKAATAGPQVSMRRKILPRSEADVQQGWISDSPDPSLPPSSCQPPTASLWFCHGGKHPRAFCFCFCFLRSLAISSRWKLEASGGKDFPRRKFRETIHEARPSCAPTLVGDHRLNFPPTADRGEGIKEQSGDKMEA